MYQHLHHEGAQRRKEKDQGIEDLFEKVMKNILNIDIQVQEMLKVPNKIRVPNKNSNTNIIFHNCN